MLVPAPTRWKACVVKGFLALLGVGLILLRVVFGRRKAFRTLELKREVAQRKTQIEELDAVIDQNKEQLERDEKLRTKMREERTRLAKDAVEKSLEIKGFSRDEIVAQLRRRGY